MTELTWIGRRARYVAITAAALALCAVPPALAQRGTNAHRPSISSPSRALNARFGQVARTLGGGNSNALARPAASPGGTTIGQALPQVGPTAARVGGGTAYSPSPGRFASRTHQEPLMTGRAPWLSHAKPGTLLKRVQNTAFGGASPVGSRGVGVFDPDTSRLGSWGAPELLARRTQTDSQVDLTAAAEDTPTVEPIPVPRLTLEQLVKNRLDGRGEVYEIQAREAFKAGRYQEASSQFALAAATSLGDPASRLPRQLAVVYASLATQQFAEALNALLAVLVETEATGLPVAAAAFNQFRDVSTLYGDPRGYVTHAQVVDQFVGSQPRDPTFLALRAMAAWGRGDVNSAIPFARALATAVRDPAAQLRRQADEAKQQAAEARQQVDEARRLIREAQTPDEAKIHADAAREAMDTVLNAGLIEYRVRAQDRKLQPWLRLLEIMQQAEQGEPPEATGEIDNSTGTGAVTTESPVPLAR